MQVGKEFLQLLLYRKTQIFAAETIVGLVLPVLCPELVSNKDITWYIDNEAAVSSLIRGTSRSSDVGHIAASSQISLLKLGCRVWYEWIDSDSNPSDGLSRAGLADPWTLAQNWILEEIPMEAMHAVQQELAAQSSSLAALGQ